MLRIGMIIKLSLLIILLIPTWAFATEIILKSGEKVDGKIIEQTDKYIKIDSGIGMAVTYYNDEIDTVDGQNLRIQKPKDVHSSALLNSGKETSASINVAPKTFSSTVTVGEKTVSIVDTFARLFWSSTTPMLTVYFFSQQLTKDQKEKLIMYPSMFINNAIGIYPVLEITFTFKDGARNCSDRYLTGYVADFEKNDIFKSLEYQNQWPERRSDQVPLSKIGVNQFSCSSLNRGSKVDIGIQKSEMLTQSSLLFAWNINIESEINWDESSQLNQSIPPTKESEPINLDSNDFLPLTDSFNLQGLFLWYYQLHGQWPQNSNTEELKNISNRMAANSRVDPDAYDFDFQPQDDGGLKVKFKLKTNSDWGNMSLQKPVPK